MDMNLFYAVSGICWLIVDPMIPDDTSGMKKRFIQIVKDKGYERRQEAFKLSSGGLSHDYIDIRRAFSDRAHAASAANFVMISFEERNITFDVIGGMTMGADPISHAVAVVGAKSWFSVRKQEKAHGRQQRIEGALLNGEKKVILVEDTVSTGRSLLEAFDVLKEAKVEVRALCTLLDRGLSMAEKMDGEKTLYIPLITYQDLEIDPL